MNSLTARTTALATIAAGATWFLSSPLQIFYRPEESTEVNGTPGHLALTLFALALLATAISIHGFAARAGSRIAPYIVSAGCVALAIAATASNVRGEDASWFPAVAAPANLMWLGGTIAIVVGLRRRAAAPAWVLVALPLVQILNLPLAFAGGGIVAGTLMIAMGALLRTGSLRPRGAGRVQPAAA